MPEYKGLTSRTRDILRAPEGFDVDFKSNAGGIKTRDIVAFVNSPEGGTILIGVEEFTNDSGVQRGKIIGCTVDGNAVLQIRNKASDCIPPIELHVITENLTQKPILRVEIPHSQKLPHCTKTGEYSIRSERRTRGLWPEELLAIFLRREADQFLGKFREAIEETEHKIDDLNSKLYETSENIVQTVENLQRDIEENLNEIFSNAEEASANADEANATIQDVYGLVHELRRDTSSLEVIEKMNVLHRSVDAIIHHMGIKDPDANRKIRELENFCFIMFNSGKLSEKEIRKRVRSTYPYIDDSVIAALISRVKSEVRKRKRNGL